MPRDDHRTAAAAVYWRHVRLSAGMQSCFTDHRMCKSYDLLSRIQTRQKVSESWRIQLC